MKPVTQQEQEYRRNKVTAAVLQILQKLDEIHLLLKLIIDAEDE
jgi:hypothetical protein